MLVFRILFVNHVQAAFAANDLVVGAALLDRGSSFIVYVMVETVKLVCWGCGLWLVAT